MTVSPSPATRRDLALLGGPPAFSEPRHVGRPNIGDRQRFLDRAGEMFDRRWFTNDGPLVQEFERRIADTAGVRHAVAMCNATVALEIAIRALDLAGEVIVPSFTFVATAHALQWQEITPVFGDIDLTSHTLDPARLERLITPRTTGIIGVHLWGRACDTDALALIATKHGLRLMYDAAHAFGCSKGERMIGGFGACEVFSFHATKSIGAFEGGAVVTNDDDLASKMRLMRNFGFAGYDRVIYLGTNGKMTEICAAMGLTSMDAIEAIVGANKRNYDLYRTALGHVPGLSLVTYDEADRSTYQYVVIEVDPDVCPLDRDSLVAALHAENVLARRYFWPGCHRMEPYRSLQPNAYLLLPVTERVAENVLVLPTGDATSASDVEIICDIIHAAVSQSHQVRAALSDAGRP